MRKTMLLCVPFVFILAFCLSSSFASSEKGAESIVLKGGNLGDVTFPHGRHQGVTVDCQPCHTMFPEESGVIEKMKNEAKLKKKEVMDVCKACHKERISKGEKAGPTTCKGCHQK